MCQLISVIHDTTQTSTQCHQHRQRIQLATDQYGGHVHFVSEVQFSHPHNV